MSAAQLAAAGLGKMFYDTGRGVQQFFGGRSQAQVDEDRRLDAPLLNTAAGNVGYIGGQIGAMSVPVGNLGRVLNLTGEAAPFLGSAARAGAFQATQPVGSGETRLGNTGEAAMAGLVGEGAAQGLGRISRGVVPTMTPAARALAQKADALGFRVGLPQLSENPMIRTVASQMDRLPLSGAGKRARLNQETFNRQVGATFGAPERALTPDVYAGAKQRIGNVFDELTQRNSLTPDASMQQGILDLINETQRLGLPEHARMVQGWADDLTRRQVGVGPGAAIPGAGYKEWRSNLGAATKNGGSEAFWLGKLRDIVEGGMDRSISPADQRAWQAARQAYANAKTVEPLIAKSPKGDISPAALMGRVTADSAGKARMATGRAGQLGDLARIGQAYLKDAPNSGTADRLLVNLGIGGGLLGAQQTGLIDPKTALAAGGLLMLNRMGSKALNSRALAMGESRALRGLARVAKPAPRALPATVNAVQGLLAMDPEQRDNALSLLSGY